MAQLDYTGILTTAENAFYNNLICFLLKLSSKMAQKFLFHLIFFAKYIIFTR